MLYQDYVPFRLRDSQFEWKGNAIFSSIMNFFEKKFFFFPEKGNIDLMKKIVELLEGKILNMHFQNY